jgi:nucleotide-binding universal stress UspA family protein
LCRSLCPKNAPLQFTSPPLWPEGWARVLRSCTSSHPCPLNHAKYFPEIRHYYAEVKRDAKERLKALAAAVSEGVKTRVLLSEDTPHDGIIRAAREDQCDLISLPTRGLKGLKRLMLGSTAEKVVRHAHCPVLTFNRHLAIGGKMTPKSKQSKQSSNRLPEKDHIKQA